jgi:hypothetical protein
MGAVQQVLMAVGTSVFLPSNLIADASGESYSDEAASAGVTLSLGTNGTLLLEYSASGTLQTPSFPVSEQYTWLIGGSPALYSVRMRKILGNNFTSGSAAIDTWIPVTSSLDWYMLSSSSIFQPYNANAITAVLELAYTNNLTNILAQCNISFSTLASTQGGFIP